MHVERDTGPAYFERTDERAFRATEHVGGAWSTAEQHVAPALGLLVHLVETDRDARGRGRLAVSRLSFDILGTMPVGPSRRRSGSCGPAGRSSWSRRS